MNDDINMMSVFMLVLISTITGLFFLGYGVGRYSIKEDCDSFGMYKVHGTVYECKVKQ
jgi:hypothetical protein